MCRIAVTIATYRRPDGKTPAYLKRCLDSVFSQKHDDYKVYLIGDCYDNVKEWNALVLKYYCDKFYCFNMAKPGERGKYRDKVALWSVGGTAAFNFGIDTAIEDGFDYICHLDHDDYWSNDHLEHINHCITSTGADWICTKSTYGGRIMPQDTRAGYILPHLPYPGCVINSSTCYNYKTIPLRGNDTNITLGKAIPSDADLWDRMYKYMIENNKKGCLINKLTCFHAEEGASRSL